MTAAIPSKILTSENIALLKDYQKAKIENEVKDFLILNAESDRFLPWHKCPKCGTLEPGYSPRGYTNKGKPILKCNVCGRTTVVDAGQLTYYSHHDQDAWDQVVEDTFNGVPLRETSKKIGVHLSTAWQMRHKLLHACEQLADQVELENEVEMDEKYIPESEKGQKKIERKPRHRGEAAHKRGLSNCQVCLTTGIQRSGDSFLKATNLGNPRADELMQISPFLKDNCLIWIDGKTSYNKLIEAKHCECRVVGNHKTYTSVDHLNNVNSFHSAIDTWIVHWRNFSTKYANRYCSFLTLWRKYRDSTAQEIKLKLIKSLRNITDYFYVRQMKVEDLFNY